MTSGRFKELYDKIRHLLDEEKVIDTIEKWIWSKAIFQAMEDITNLALQVTP